MEDHDASRSGIWQVAELTQRQPTTALKGTLSEGNQTRSLWHASSTWLHVGAAVVAALAIVVLAAFISLFVAVTSVLAVLAGIYCKLQLRSARRRHVVPSTV